MNVEPVAFSPAMRNALGAALDVAAAPTTVLLTGETGTGKEVLARFIHQLSARTASPSPSSPAPRSISSRPRPR